MPDTISTASAVREVPPSTRPSRPFALATALLAAVAFCVSLALAAALAGSSVHAEWNVLFDADPNVYLHNFATGYTIGTWGGRGLVHPNLTNLVYPVVRLLALVIGHLPAHVGSKLEIRDALAFHISPVVAVIRVVLVMLLMQELGLSLAWSIGLTLLDMASFSTLLFSSIPESYAFTGAVVLALFWLGARTARSQQPPGVASWLFWTALATAIATLNLGAAAIVRTFTEASRRPFLRAAAMTAAIAAVALFVNLAALKASQRVFDARPLGLVETTPQIADAWDPGIDRALVDYPRALANGIAAPPPAIWAHPDSNYVHPFVLTLERGRPGVRTGDPRTVLVLLFLAFAAVAGWRWLPRMSRPIHMAALVVLAEGAVVHAFFGKELLLYTQHWHAAVLVLLASLYYAPPPARRILDWALPGLVAVVAVNNLLTMSAILRILRLP